MQGTYQRLPLDGLGTDSQPNRCMEHSSAVGAWTEEQSMRVSHAYIRRSTFAGVVGQERETLFAGCSVLLVGLTIVEVPCYLRWSIVICNIDNELLICCVAVINKSLYLKVYLCPLPPTQARSFVYTFEMSTVPN